MTVALGRHCQLFEITLSEDRGYLTPLLLGACEEVLHSHHLSTLAINPDGLILLGDKFPEQDLVLEIAKQWQKKIDRVFSSNVEQLVGATKDGIKIDDQAIQQNPDGALEEVDKLLVKKLNSYKSDKLARDIEKYGSDAGEKAIQTATELGLLPVSNADEFALSEGLKTAYLSYREANLSPKDAWDRIGELIELSSEQRIALEPFNAQYGRCLFAAQIAKNRGMEGIQAILQDSFQLRHKDSNDNVSEDLVTAVQSLLNLPVLNNWQGGKELTAYIEANPRERCSLGTTSFQVSELVSNQMPPSTKVQSFSNRLPGGMSAEPKRRADNLAALSYQLLAVGANFPKAGKQEPLYLHFALPQGSSPELKAIWQKWLALRFSVWKVMLGIEAS